MSDLPTNLVLAHGDWDTNLNARDFLEQVLSADPRIKITGKGVGPDSSDLDITIDGELFSVSIRPRL